VIYYLWGAIHKYIPDPVTILFLAALPLIIGNVVNSSVVLSPDSASTSILTIIQCMAGGSFHSLPRLEMVPISNFRVKQLLYTLFRIFSRQWKNLFCTNAEHKKRL
jgi:hypothetical protein